MNVNQARIIEDSITYQMIGQGNTAEIFQYGDNKILKLFREGIPNNAIECEYNRNVVIQEELHNTPKAYEMVCYHYRYGIVYEQIKGNDFIFEMLKHAFHRKANIKLLASIHAKMHNVQTKVDYSVKQKLVRDVQYENDLTDIEKEKIITYIDTLPDGEALCHFDFHPGNVMICNQKPYVIDWMTACKGDACADVARTMLLFQFGELSHVNLLVKLLVQGLIKTVGKNYLKEYSRLTGISKQDISKWMMPIAAARLTEWVSEHEKKKLIAFIRKELIQ